MSIAVGLAWAEDARRKAAAEIERLRLTDEEREVLESLVFVARLYAPERTAGVIQRLLERLGKVEE